MPVVLLALRSCPGIVQTVEHLSTMWPETASPPDRCIAALCRLAVACYDAAKSSATEFEPSLQ